MTDVALTSVAVTITLTENATGISISVSREPINLQNELDEVEIEWELADAAYAAGWTFASQGIDIKAPAVVFKNKKGLSLGKKHRWKRHPNHRDGNEYKYTINVENLDKGTKLTWDPFILNN